MRITKRQLRQIIKEELQCLLEMNSSGHLATAAAIRADNEMQQRERDAAKPKYKVKVVEGSTPGEYAIYVQHPGGSHLVGARTRNLDIVKRWEQASEQQLMDYLDSISSQVVGYVNPKTGADAYGGKPPPPSGTGGL